MPSISKDKLWFTWSDILETLELDASDDPAKAIDEAVKNYTHEVKSLGFTAVAVNERKSIKKHIFSTKTTYKTIHTVIAYIFYVYQEPIDIERRLLMFLGKIELPKENPDNKFALKDIRILVERIIKQCIRSKRYKLKSTCLDEPDIQLSIKDTDNPRWSIESQTINNEILKGVPGSEPQVIHAGQVIIKTESVIVNTTKALINKFKEDQGFRNKVIGSTVFLMCFGAYLVYPSSEKASDAIQETNEPQTQQEVLYSDVDSSDSQAPIEVATDVVNNEVIEQPSASRSTTPNTPTKSRDVKKSNSAYDNMQMVIKPQLDSEPLPPALLNKIIETYKNQYQFIAGTSASSNTARFECKTNFKVTYKESAYTEGIISCNISLSYQIIDNSSKSIVKSNFVEAGGIGHSKGLARQNAIEKLNL